MKLKTNWETHLHAIRRHELEVVLNELKGRKFEKAIEFGCGDGFQSKEIAKFSEKLFATDYQLDPNKYPSSFNNIVWQDCDAEKISDVFPDQKFDFIFSSNMLEHLPNLPKALEEMKNVLSDNGVMIHIVPSFFWKFANFFLYHLNFLLLLIEAIFTKNGFEILKEKKIKVDDSSIGNNRKITGSKKKSLISYIIPRIHGVSKSNMAEFRQFRKNNWIRIFLNAGFIIMKIRKGPICSGYGFGMDVTRNILESLGFTSVYIFFLKKNTYNTKYNT